MTSHSELSIPKPPAPKLIHDKDGQSLLWPSIFKELSFSELLDLIDWQQEHITLFGKTHPIPRLSCWYGEHAYQYSNIRMPAQALPKPLKNIQNQIQAITEIEFNSVLCNYYPTGKHYAAWHSDNEKELGESPNIASVSIGGVRRFCLRHKQTRQQKDLMLNHGDLLLMQAPTQTYWQHQLAKTAKSVSPRINLTFRYTHQST